MNKQNFSYLCITCKKKEKKLKSQRNLKSQFMRSQFSSSGGEDISEHSYPLKYKKVSEQQRIPVVGNIINKNYDYDITGKYNI